MNTNQHPGNSESDDLWDLAIKHRDAGRFTTALVMLSHFREKNPSDDSTDLVFAQLLTHVGRLDEAYDVLTNTNCANHPGSFPYLSAWVAFFRDKRDPQNEEVWCRRMIAEIPDQSHGFIYLGCCLARQGKSEAAESAFREGALLKGHPEEALYNLAMVLCTTTRLDEARTVLEDALQIDPDDERIVKAIADVDCALEYLANAR